jgi:hypothetical protein
MSTLVEHMADQSTVLPEASAPSTPTRQAYHELQWAYDHFNRALFAGALPACMITLQREKATFGYFSSKRFAHSDGQITDEIALNPAYFAVVPLVETLQTLVHEMCHLWQDHHGKPGGRRTGDCVADYAIEGGPFLAACAALMTERFTLSWYDRFPAPRMVAFGESAPSQALPAAVGGGHSPVQQHVALAQAVVTPGQNAQTASGQAQPVNRSNRLKYRCAGGCGANVWGKPGLAILCGVCNAPFAQDG